MANLPVKALIGCRIGRVPSFNSTVSYAIAVILLFNKALAKVGLAPNERKEKLVSPGCKSSHSCIWNSFTFTINSESENKRSGSFISSAPTSS